MLYKLWTSISTHQIFCSILYNKIKICLNYISLRNRTESLCLWPRIHWDCNCKTPPNEYPGYDTKQFDGEAPVMLELWRIQSTLLLPLLPGPLWSRVVAPDKVLSILTHLFLWHINPCRLFNAKSFLYIHIKSIWFGLVEFYGLSTIAVYLMPNPLYTYL